MPDTYTIEEFAQACAQRGYCTRATAERYARRVRGRPLTDADMIEAYRAEEARMVDSNSAFCRPGAIRTTRIWREDEE